MLAIPVSSQSALQRFEREFRAAVHAGSEAVTDEQFAAALQALAAVEPLIEDLPPEYRDLARFWTGVRRAEILYHGGEELRMVRDALATREAAMAAPPFKEGRPVYAGYYRVVLLTLLWQAMPDAKFFDLVERGDEAAFVLAPEGGIGRDQDRSDAGQTEFQKDPFGDVGREHRHPVPRLDAQLANRARGGQRFVAELAESEGSLPRAERDAVGPGRGRRVEQSEQGRPVDRPAVLHTLVLRGQVIRHRDRRAGPRPERIVLVHARNRA